MTKEQISKDLRHEYLALAFCQNAYQTKLVEENIARLEKLRSEIK